MRNVKCPEKLSSFTHKEFSKTLFDKISENKLDKCSQKAIFDAYDNYVEHKKNLELLSPIEFEQEITKEQWNDIYKNIKDELLKKWRELLGDENIPSRCPSCGISAPSDAEHFLARSQYREFSAFMLNLIPWCSICNRKKGKYLTDSNGVRKFLNCYWDDIDKYCFWECQVDIIQYTVSFNVVQPKGCPDELFKIVNNHASHLDLSNRFLKLGTDKLNEIIIEIKQFKTMPLKTVTSIIDARIQAITEMHGINYWERILYIGFLKSLTPSTWQYIISMT